MWYTQKRYKPPITRLELADNAIYAFAPGFWFGRMGCSVAHDHPGVPTDSPLAVTWPAGRWPGYEEFDIARTQAVQAHDLGLYEALYLMPLIVLGVVLISRWKGRKPGMMLAYACLVYSVPRFFLEYLRLEGPDPRYAGLTPAQWFSIMLFGAGIYLVVHAIPRYKKTTFELAHERIASGEFKPYDPDDEKQQPPPRARAKKKTSDSPSTKKSSGASANKKSSGGGQKRSKGKKKGKKK
jgi:phosphatidylglycerol:prolipoprotein diacylglycerol transferase